MATTFTPKTFPGVYTSIIDKSFFQPATSRFKPGLIGVASKGPFNTPTVIASLKDFVRTFGNPIKSTPVADTSTGLITYGNTGYFLADAVDAIADYTDAITVVRIGNQFTPLAPSDGYVSGGDSYTLYSRSNAPRIQALLNEGNPVYLRIHEDGLPSTVNVAVYQAGGGTIALDPTALDPTGNPLAVQYGQAGGAAISYSAEPAANAAEGVLYCYTYGSNSSQLTDYPVTALGSITGQKNQFEFAVESNANLVAVGDVYKIVQANKKTTHEVRVASVLVDYTDMSGVVSLEKSSNQQIGYQALPLQDNYTDATLYKATGQQIFLRLYAASAGDWANGKDSSQGMYVKVRPGSKPGTKKLEVYWNSALMETHDNLVDDAASPDYWATRLQQGVSNYVYVSQVNNLFDQNWTAANTVAPWDGRFYSDTQTEGLPVPMPVGAVNAGWLAVTPGNVQDTGGQFTQGYNGENPQDADWIGTLDPVTDKLSGIRAFENKRTVSVNIIAAPMDGISLAVMTQLASTNFLINGYSPVDVPTNLNGRQAIDWHNGHLAGQDSGMLDSHNVGVYWNWCQRSNSWGETKLVPPTVFWLRAAAFTFNAYAPWFAIAGETRGYLPEAQKAQFDDVSEDTLQAMYGNGNSVNPILNFNGRFFLYGERTMQRLESKLTAVHSVLCVNWTVNGLAVVARRFVFDPNDAELLDNLRLAFTEFLERIKNERGLEDYSLTITATPDDRNNRQVIVDLGLIPTDTVERIYINATVYESGAQINSIS